MFAVEVCPLPTTGGATGVAVAAVFLLVLGVIVARWTRGSAGRVSFVAVVPLLFLGIGAVSMRPSSSTCNASPTTTAPPVTAPPTTLAPLILEIDTSLLPPVQVDSVTSLDAGFVYELGLFGDVDVHVDWGDGLSDEVTVAGPFAHTYTTSGQYTITVSGTLTGLGQGSCCDVLLGAQYLTAVHSFGNLGIESLMRAFLGANNLTEVPSTLPATVTNMRSMFEYASVFNQSLDSWDTSGVTDMSYMFSGPSSFNQSLSSWDTSSVKYMSYMFYGASSFNESMTGWDTSSVTRMRLMFYGASSFNQNLADWDTSNVTNMKMMFTGASLFNSDLGGWDTSNVTNMSDMFSRASAFNQSLSSWDTSSVTDMSYMFFGASSFAGDISGWVTSNVTNMDHMFYFAESFNSDLGGWDISNVTDMSDMLHESGLSKTNYDDTLIGWSTLVGPETLKPDVELGASGLKFSSTGAAARAVLMNSTNNWNIVGDILE